MSGEVVELEIDCLAYGGSGVGSVVAGPSDLQGKRGFVAMTAPGDRIHAEVIENRDSFLQARLLEIIVPSPSRVAPRCEYFGVCGGCDYQHITLEAQRHAKRQLVESTLARQFKITPRSGVTLLGAQLPGWEYRRRVSLHVSIDGAIGFFKPKSGEVVAIRRCLISSSGINEMLAKLATPLKELGAVIAGAVIEEGPSGVSVLLRPRTTIALNDGRLDAVKAVVTSLQFESPSKGEVDPQDALGHFSQVNEVANELLVETVLQWLPDQEIIELYAGAGNFSFPLARRGAMVTAVEVDRTLVKKAQHKAGEEGLENRLTFLAMSTESFLNSRPLQASVLLDPPRSGAKAVVSRAQPETIARIVYVSCNVPTLGRDLQILKSKGFEVVRTAVIDMFPQTHHVETITELVAT